MKRSIAERTCRFCGTTTDQTDIACNSASLAQNCAWATDGEKARAAAEIAKLQANNDRLREALDLDVPPLHFEMRAKEAWSFIRRFSKADWHDEPSAVRRTLTAFEEEASDLIAGIHRDKPLDTALSRPLRNEETKP